MPSNNETVSAALSCAVMALCWAYFTGRLDGLLHSYQESGIPSEEAQFLHAMHGWEEKWRNAPNDFQKEPMYQQRESEICAFPRKVSGWIGKVDSVGSSAFSDNAIFAVNLSPSVTVKTTSSFSNDGSMISRRSTVFQQIYPLKEGDQIVFSGSFLPGDSSCFRELSLTTGGSMSSPEFGFIFSEVEKR